MTTTRLWEFPQWVPKKRLGLVTETRLILMMPKKELLTTQVTLMKPEKELPLTQQYRLRTPQVWRMILGAGRDSGGCGRGILVERLSRLGKQLHPAIPATCAFGESNEGILSQTAPRHRTSLGEAQASANRGRRLHKPLHSGTWIWTIVQTVPRSQEWQGAKPPK